MTPDPEERKRVEMVGLSNTVGEPPPTPDPETTPEGALTPGDTLETLRRNLHEEHRRCLDYADTIKVLREAGADLQARVVEAERTEMDLRESLADARLAPKHGCRKTAEGGAQLPSECGALPSRPRCGFCRRYYAVDFRVPDRIWSLAVKSVHTPACLTCFIAMADERLLRWDAEIEFFPVSLESHRIEVLPSAEQSCRKTVEGEGQPPKETPSPVPVAPGEEEPKRVNSSILYQFRDMTAKPRRGCTGHDLRALAARLLWVEDALTRAVDARDALEGRQEDDIDALVHVRTEVLDNVVADLKQTQDRMELEREDFAEILNQKGPAKQPHDLGDRIELVCVSLSAAEAEVGRATIENTASMEALVDEIRKREAAEARTDEADLGRKLNDMADAASSVLSTVEWVTSLCSQLEEARADLKALRDAGGLET